MFTVTKTFYPVGQGGFYFERIACNGDVKTIVYDCGSVIGKTKNGPTPELKKCIINSGLGKVDFLVVSHLDEDHINGIPVLETYLKQNSSKQPILLMPKPTPFDKVLLFKNASEESVSWYLNAAAQDRIIYITDEIIVDNTDDPIILESSVSGYTFSHTKNFAPFRKVNGKIPWLLKFYVHRNKYKGKLQKDDENLIDSIKTIDDFKQNKDDLKNIYDKVKYNQNGSSMSMASLPFYAKDNMRDSFATWLNGDARLKTRKEMSAIELHFSCLDGLDVDFQVPHHGSHLNIQHLPNNVNDARTYIWAGFDNQYGHPSGTVLNMIRAANKPYSLITEKTVLPIVIHETWF